MDVDETKRSVAEKNKKCIFVNRSCLRDLCVGWINNNCFIYHIANSMMCEKDNPAVIGTNLQKKSSGSLRDSLEDLEKRLITEAMIKAADNQTRASEILGMSERMLRYKLKKYDLKN